MRFCHFAQIIKNSVFIARKLHILEVVDDDGNYIVFMYYITLDYVFDYAINSIEDFN